MYRRASGFKSANFCAQTTENVVIAIHVVIQFSTMSESVVLAVIILSLDPSVCNLWCGLRDFLDSSIRTKITKLESDLAFSNINDKHCLIVYIQSKNSN